MSKQSPATQPPQGPPGTEEALSFLHDLRGPLSLVIVYGELLQTEPGTLNAKQEHYLKQIQSGAETLEREIEAYLQRLQSPQGDQ